MTIVEKNSLSSDLTYFLKPDFRELNHQLTDQQKGVFWVNSTLIALSSKVIYMGYYLARVEIIINSGKNNIVAAKSIKGPIQRGTCEFIIVQLTSLKIIDATNYNSRIELEYSRSETTVV